MSSDYKPISQLKPNENECAPIITNNLNCQTSAGQGVSPCRPCTPVELVKNGGFEEFGVFETFAGWDSTANQIRVSDSGDSYEGFSSAYFNSLQSNDIQEKSAFLFQNVTVNPECFLVLSFAENFLGAGTDFDKLGIGARVSYDGAARTDLINIETFYNSAEQAGKGFVFHQRAAGVPVPSNVSSVRVEFEVRVTDRSGPGGPGTQTILLLDGVSLRAV